MFCGVITHVIPLVSFEKGNHLNPLTNILGPDNET
jgi:hypothetical protein